MSKYAIERCPDCHDVLVDGECFCNAATAPAASSDATVCSCSHPGETHSPALHLILGDPLPDTLRLLPLHDLAQAVLMRRTWQGLTSRDLAAEIGVSPSTITRVEQGKPPAADVYRRLCLWLARPAGEFQASAGRRAMAETETEWCVFYGGEDPDNCAGYKIYRIDGEACAYEDVQWMKDAGVAKRSVVYGPWEVQP